MKLAPLGDKVVLKQVEAQETTKSGIPERKFINFECLLIIYNL